MSTLSDDQRDDAGQPSGALVWRLLIRPDTVRAECVGADGVAVVAYDFERVGDGSVRRRLSILGFSLPSPGHESRTVHGRPR